MVADAVCHEEPFVIPGCAEGGIRQGDRGKDSIRWAPWVTDAEGPGPTLFEAGGQHVSPELNQKVVEAGPVEDRRYTVDREPLSNPAQMRTHALPLEIGRSSRGVQRERLIVEEGQAGLNLRGIGNAVVLVLGVELPETR